jgi:predicted acetyltransferase
VAGRPGRGAGGRPYAAAVAATSPAVRPLRADEADAALDLLAVAFADPTPGEADRAAERSVFEPERSLGAFDGDRLVATLSTFSFDMSVPGGSLPVAGTTWVAVSPTHRRRGVAAGLLRRHLEDVADRGEPLAALWASEAGIYGRFGYGVAIETQRIAVQVGPGLAFAPSAPAPAVEVAPVAPVDAAERLDPIWSAVRGRRAGMHARSPAWWGYQILSEREACTPGGSPKRVAVARAEGRDVAYAVYATASAWDDAARPTGTMTVLELAGVDGAAEAAMWRFLLQQDLLRGVTALRRPVDDALPLLLAEPRRAQRTVVDGLHVRVVDVVGALTGRGYVESAGVTIEVVDDLLPANDGTWRVEVAPEGAAVTPDPGSTPDLRLPIRALGAAVMGDVPIRRLAAAGLVEVTNPAVLDPLDAALRAPEAGWASEVW